MSHPQPGLRGAKATSADESRSALCGDSFGLSAPAGSRGGPGRESRQRRAVPSAATGLAGGRRAPALLASPARQSVSVRRLAGTPPSPGSRSSGNCSLNPRTNHFNPRNPGNCSLHRERLFYLVLTLSNYRSPDNKFKCKLNQQPYALICKIRVSNTLTCFKKFTGVAYLNTKSPFPFCTTPTPHPISPGLSSSSRTNHLNSHGCCIWHLLPTLTIYIYPIS